MDTDWFQKVAIRQFLLTNLIRSPETKAFKLRIPISTLAASLDHMGDFPFKDPEEARFEGPALFIRGTKSHYIADDALPLVGKFFPKFQLVDVDAGHWVISENPKAFGQGNNFILSQSRDDAHDLAAVIEFIKEVDSRD